MIHVYTYRIMIPMICISIESMIPMILYTFKTSVLLFVERLPIADRGCCQSAAGCPSHFSGGKSWEILGPTSWEVNEFPWLSVKNWRKPWKNHGNIEKIEEICTYMEKLKKTMETLQKTMEKLKHIMDKPMKTMENTIKTIEKILKPVEILMNSANERV